MSMIHSPAGDHSYTLEVINPIWVRIYALIQGKQEFIGAERPFSIFKKVNQYLAEWPEGSRCILAFSETHYCVYGKRINPEKTEILLQDREAKDLARRIMSVAELREIVGQYKQLIDGIGELEKPVHTT